MKKYICKDGKMFGYTSKERFDRMVLLNASTSCWEWQGGIMKNGYGQFLYEGKKSYAHRASYMIYKGEIPPKIDVCHKCDNRKCVNPDHLFLGTRKDNIQDCLKKGRFMSEKRLEAQSLLWVRRKANNPNPFEPNHPSLTAYTKYKCRCEPCRALFSEYQSNRKINKIINEKIKKV